MAHRYAGDAVATCAVCKTIILFGGHRLGDARFCSARCLIRGRNLFDQGARAAGNSGTARVEDLRDDLIAVANDLDRQQELLTDIAERLDFLERTVVQLRQDHGPGQPPSSEAT